jgi:phosphatidylglycerophosphatase A
VQVAVAGVVGRPRIKGVVGLMFDDVLAGIYAAIVLAIAA